MSATVIAFPVLGVTERAILALLRRAPERTFGPPSLDEVSILRGAHPATWNEVDAALRRLVEVGMVRRAIVERVTRRGTLRRQRGRFWALSNRGRKAGAA